MAHIAWIGLGNMGGPMTANLVAAGHKVAGYDLDERALAAAAEAGVRAAGSIAEAIDGADAVFTMLPKGEHVRGVYEGETGIWALADPRTLLIDSSTSDLETSRYLHEESERRDRRFLDAPVSGGISGAKAGTLAFMLGGGAENVEAARELIEPMAAKVIHAGGPTMGLAAKICNNMMLFVNLVATAEGSQLADELGLDPKVFWEIASVSSGKSWAQQTWYPVPGVIESAAANNNFAATFTGDLAAKDIGIALAAGERAGVDLPAAQLAAGQFARLAEEGLGTRDCSLIAKYAAKDGTLRGWDPDAD